MSCGDHCLRREVQALALRLGALEREIVRLRRGGGGDVRPRQVTTMTAWIATDMVVGETELRFLETHELVEVVQQVLVTAAPSPPWYSGFVWDSPIDAEEPRWLRLTLSRWLHYFAKIQHRFRRALGSGGDLELLRKITFCREMDKKKLLRRLS